MKIFLCLSLLVSACGALSQEIGTGRFRGDYFGIVLPVGTGCSTERLLMTVTVDPAGEMRGEIMNWDGVRQASIEHRLDSSGKFVFNTGTNSLPPFPECFPFCPEEPGSGWLMRGSTSSKSGTMKGYVDGRYKGACKYTFTLYRRFKNN